jgi:5-methylcytosine-specific restriction enzyme subunit McrC
VTLSADPIITLREYEEKPVSLSTEAVRALRRLPPGRLSVGPTDLAGTWNVKATSYVGTVTVPGCRIIVRPKVPIANVFHMLEAGGKSLDLDTSSFDYETASDLTSAFGTFYARVLERIVSRGLPRRYIPCEDRLFGIRGRVDLRSQIRSVGLALPVSCQFDEYTADTQLNRIMKAAARRLLTLRDLADGTRRDLSGLIAWMDDVGAVQGVDVRAPTRFTRLDEHCTNADQLARLVLEDSSILDEAGSTGASAFLIDMNKVFESFVESRLRRYLSGRLMVLGQRHQSLDEAGDISIIPDLVFADRTDRIVFVADAKYKVSATGFGREGDYYQMLAYCTSLGLAKGLLIYCLADGQAPSRVIRVRNSGIEILTWAVRLDGSPANIEREMQDLAHAIAGEATAVNGLHRHVDASLLQ